MPGARCTRSLVCSVLVAHECSHHGRTGITRHSRTRMVLTASFVVSPAIGLSCHRHLADTSAKLDAGVEASGPHDFAVRFSAVRQERCRVHRIPHPTSVTIAKRPSMWDGMASDIDLICPIGERKSFCKRGWTGEIRLIRLDKFARARKRRSP